MNPEIGHECLKTVLSSDLLVTAPVFSHTNRSRFTDPFDNNIRNEFFGLRPNHFHIWFGTGERVRDEGRAQLFKERKTPESLDSSH
jgi:hypothetical protein